MNIGEKIRQLRIAKLMTQSDLAGKRITRNMLSCIENGSANPSLSTILYIAERLNVPAGFLLAEEGDEIVYRKINALESIKSAYTAGDLWSCRSLCVSGCPEPDDEISLLLSNCDTGIAVEEFEKGRLRSSCRFFDEALSYAEKTIYPTDAVKATAQIYFRYMERISHTLYSDMLDADTTLPYQGTSPLVAYLDALDALDDNRIEKAHTFLQVADSTSFEYEHIRIRLMIRDKQYDSAQKALLGLLKRETPLSKIAFYTVMCELELCCREMEDFRGAYGYANQKVEILEQLLKDI